MRRVFIDGSAGTTGLRIRERLTGRADIELITLDDSARKDDNKRREALMACDLAFLCLPDAAARQAVALMEGSNAVIIDASTAHRVNAGFAYGFPELSEAHARAITSARRIAVPGCHASGFIALVYPLIEAGVLDAGARLCCHSITGFSGGGKQMIADYQSGRAGLAAPRQYALAQAHKHLPEMQIIPGLKRAPAFCPIVADYYSGMLVSVIVFKEQLASGMGIEDARRTYARKYAGGVVKYVQNADEAGFMNADALAGRDDMQIMVDGNDDRILLMARFDNLGKGASGAAIQCMNIAIGARETEGLVIEGSENI